MAIRILHNETALVLAMQEGNKEAFTALYLHYSPQLYMNVLGMVRDPLVAEEIVQELFIKIWQKRESKSINENFAGYLYRSAQHLVHDFFRKLQRDRTLLEQFRALAQINYLNNDETLDDQGPASIVEKAISQLSPQQKKVYELIKGEGVSYKKAAEIMGISPLTVKEYIVSANKSIRNYVLSHKGSSLDFLALILFYTTQS